MTTQTYAVTYTNANGKNSVIRVKARNESEAISNAKNLCFTGSNFRHATITGIPYTKPSNLGYQGSGRM
jgi:hypothetical protein